MTEILAEIIKKLKRGGYKLTPQRKAVIEVMLENQDKHLSSEEIYDVVKKDYPEIGLATVYRTLNTLDELSIIVKMNFNDGCIRYELDTDEEHHHHHLICRECGKVIEVKEDLLEDIEREIENKYDFQILDHNLKFYGICNVCKNSQ